MAQTIENQTFYVVGRREIWGFGKSPIYYLSDHATYNGKCHDGFFNLSSPFDATRHRTIDSAEQMIKNYLDRICGLPGVSAEEQKRREKKNLRIFRIDAQINSYRKP